MYNAVTPATAAMIPNHTGPPSNANALFIKWVLTAAARAVKETVSTDVKMTHMPM
ncbi:hypothetical protein M5J15_06980 [Serratia symbiotica]|uniref:hypothetical protein n=1 Tax=Serratia symbiotica TaxID=138074 RepID=UPI001DA6E173|nr:hypothetical protein [Serratia symbiotica]NIG87317.1 hypothetical protein [Serratia symbiotica]USS96572.1 hypothetical protein M5J15_06980 [Serratia symbiotica]